MLAPVVASRSPLRASVATVGLAVFITAILVNAIPGPVHAQIVRQDLYVTNGLVYSESIAGNTLYIGGEFTQVGPATGTGVTIDATTGLPTAGFAKVAGGDVRAAISDGAGGWYIGGDFVAVNGVARAQIARILSDGSLSSWNPGTNGSVIALALSSGILYVGGQFSSVYGLGRNFIAAINATTGAATSWNPSANAAVQTLAVNGTTVYAGGSFTTIGGQARNRIAALSTTTGLASAWNPNANFAVNVLEVSGTTVYAGGAFSTIGGQTRNGAAELDATTGLATAWNPNANSSVWALKRSGTTVYLGGLFSTVGGQVRNEIAAVNTTTGAPSSWNPSAIGGYVTALAVSGSTVYAGGQFSNIGGQIRNCLAALDATTGNALAWNPNVSGYVSTLGVSGSAVFAGGHISTIGGQGRRSIAALDLTTGAVTAWNPTSYDAVYTVAANGTTVYAGGQFFSIGGQVRNYIAALDATTGLATNWDPNADGGVHCIAVSGTTVYAGGSFNTIGGQTRNRIAALDATTGLATAWNPNASDWVLTLTPAGSTVYATGRFTSIGGQTRNYIAALSAITGLATVFNPNADGSVTSLAVNGATVYAGGEFVNIGGQPRNNIAALNSTTGLATTWNPSADSAVNALALGTGTVFAGGWFASAGGQSRAYIAELDATTGLATSWNPSAGGYANGNVNALVLSGGTLYAGGEFTAMSGLPQSGVAGISTNANCLTPSPFLTATDADHDTGGRIKVDWSGYTPPGGTTEYRVVRDTDPCVLVNGNLPPLATVASNAPKNYIDATTTDYTSYYYALRVMTGSTVADVLYAGPGVSHPDLLINEFTLVASPKQATSDAAGAKPGTGANGAEPQKISEVVEIRNQGGSLVVITGYRLSNGPGPPFPDEEVLSGVVPAGGLFVHTLTSMDIPDVGGTLLLLPPSGNDFPLDVVSYGTAGGAPAAPPGFTISRVEGTKSSDPDATSFETSTQTIGQTNTVPAPDLGHSIVINEVFTGSTTGGDYIELYNPLGSALVLDQFAVSDGVNFLTTLTSHLQLAPGQLFTLQQNAAGSFTQNLTDNLLYLYKITESAQLQRVDQLGWGGTGSPTPVAPNDAPCRIPDGLAVYQGTQGANWADCGGGSTLIYGPHTPGLPNRNPGVTQVVVAPGGGGNFTTINAALIGAAVGTRVLVNAGTYAESFSLRDGVEVRGAASDPTQVVVTGSGSGPIVTATNVGPSAVLAGITLKNGNATQGGGMLVTNASPTVINVRFEQNKATVQGGGVAVLSGNPSFTGCLFYKNSSNGDGGAAAVAGGSPQWHTSLFVLNTGVSRGGGLFASGGTSVLQSCVLDRNTTATTGAGVVHTTSGSVNFTFCAITNDLHGAALRAEGGGAGGHIGFSCGNLFGHPEPVNFAAGGIDSSNVSLVNPQFCQPLLLNYSYPSASPLAGLAARCGQNIGVAGPPCAATTTSSEPPPQPLITRLLPPAPNPFNPATTLRFDLAVAGRVTLSLYDVRGRRVADLEHDVQMLAGAHQSVWTGLDAAGRRVASGVYYARLSLDQRAVGEPQRLVLLK